MKEKGFYLLKGLFFSKKNNIYNKGTTSHKSILKHGKHLGKF